MCGTDSVCLGHLKANVARFVCKARVKREKINRKPNKWLPNELPRGFKARATAHGKHKMIEQMKKMKSDLVSYSVF